MSDEKTPPCRVCGKTEPTCNKHSRKCDGWHWHQKCWAKFLGVKNS